MSDADFYSREYNNRVLFPGHPDVMARWTEKSARTRSSMICYLDRQYGDSPGETLDIFPARKGDGTCMMFIHGGFWRAMDKQDFSFLAPAWVDAGVSVGAVNYGLGPKVSAEEMLRHVPRAPGGPSWGGWGGRCGRGGRVPLPGRSVCAWAWASRAHRTLRRPDLRR